MHQRLSILAVALWFLAAAAPARAQPCAPLDPSHRAWSDLLGRYVRGGAVDYRSWKRDDAATLERYLDALAALCRPDYDRLAEPDRIAYWINAYNAATVALVLKHYPLASIRDIGWLPLAAFRTDAFPLRWRTGDVLTLDDIEHRILRRDFREPRVHFALVCASRGCPPLASRAYTGATLDAQLDAAARGYLADRRWNRWDPAGQTLVLSKIFDWFAGDFVAAAGSVPGFVAPYFGAPTAAAITAPGVRIDFSDYDWRLNDRVK